MSSLVTIQPGARVGIYRKSRLVHVGTLLRVVDANDDMTWGHKMGTDLFVTIDVDGLGPRQWREGTKMFRAKDLRKIGRVSIRPLAMEASG